jgi:hypothetical protein
VEGEPIEKIEELLDKPVTLMFKYKDDDNDGIVEGVLPPLDEQTLKIYTLKDGRWQEVPGSKVKAEENIVEASVATLSIYGLMGEPAAAQNLTRVIVYPNPYKPHSDVGHHFGIRFKELTPVATIRIYDITGKLVYIWEETDGDGVWEWNPVKNKDGEPLASGIYIYCVTNPAGQKYIGKIVIIK